MGTEDEIASSSQQGPAVGLPTKAYQYLSTNEHCLKIFLFLHDSKVQFPDAGGAVISLSGGAYMLNAAKCLTSLYFFTLWRYHTARCRFPVTMDEGPVRKGDSCPLSLAVGRINLHPSHIHRREISVVVHVGRGILPMTSDCPIYQR